MLPAAPVGVLLSPFETIGLNPAIKTTGRGVFIGIIDDPIIEKSPRGLKNCTPCPTTDKKDPEEVGLHGLHVAKIIAGTRPPNNQFTYGFWGVAPDAHIVAYDRTITEDYDRALNNDKLCCINLSLSINTEAFAQYLINKFIPKAYAKNKVLIFSACNEGYAMNKAETGGYCWPSMLLKAAEHYPNVIIAGSITALPEAPTFGLSGSANFLPISHKNYRGSYITAPSTVYCEHHKNPQQKFVKFGTSYSAPFITGALALLKERFPHFDASTLVALLTLSATSTPHQVAINQDDYRDHLAWILHHSSFKFEYKGQTATSIAKKDTNTLRCTLTPTDDEKNLSEVIAQTASCLDALMYYAQENSSRTSNNTSNSRARLQQFSQQIKKYTISWLTQSVAHLLKSNGSACDLLTQFIDTVVQPVVSKIEGLIIFSDHDFNKHHRKNMIQNLELFNHATKVRNTLNIDRALRLAELAGNDIQATIKKTGQSAVQQLIADRHTNRLTPLNKIISAL